MGTAVASVATDAERHAAPVGEHESNDKEGQGHEEVAPRGASTLLLFLSDIETRGPVALDVQLWRLYLPETPEWWAGDHLQARVKVPVEGARIENLPPGRYRVYSPSLRLGSADAAEFEVRGPVTRTHLLVPTCLGRRLLVRVFDETGRALEHATYHFGGGMYKTRSGWRFPPWRVARKRKEPGFRRPFGGMSSHARPGPPRDIVAGPDGFDLGRIHDPSRTTDSAAWHELSFEGRSRVSLLITSDKHATSFRAVSLPASFAVGFVLLPDGRPASAQEISITCGAAPAGSPTVPVTVRVAGHESVALAYRIGDPFPVCHLRLREPRRDD